MQLKRPRQSTLTCPDLQNSASSKNTSPTEFVLCSGDDAGAEVLARWQQPQSQTLIASTVVLASSLNMDLLIEGGSHAEEWAALVEMGALRGRASSCTSHELIGWLSKPTAN